MGRFTFLRLGGNTNHRKFIQTLSTNMKLLILLTILAVAYSAPVESEVASGENEMASSEIEMASGEVEMASIENEMASGENEMASGDVEAVLEVFDEINFASVSPFIWGIRRNWIIYTDISEMFDNKANNCS